MNNSALSEPATAIAQAYALFFPERPARSKTLQWINRARKEQNLRSIKQNEMTPAINELITAGLIEPPVEAQRGVRAQGPGAILGTITHFCLQAIRSGVALQLLIELDGNTYEARYGRYNNDLPFHLEQRFRLALLSGNYQLFEDIELPPDITLWLVEPAAANFLAKMSDEHRQIVCESGLHYLAHTFQKTDTFEKICDLNTPDRLALLPIKAFIKLLCGQLNDAKSTLSALLTSENGSNKNTLVEAHSVNALIHAVEGDDDKAIEAIKQTLEAEKSGTRKKILFPYYPAFSIAMLILPRANNDESNRLFSDLLQARKKLKHESYFDTLFALATKARLPQTYIGSLGLPTASTLGSFLFAIATRWHKDYYLSADKKHTLRRIDNLLYTASQNGFDWVAAELQGVLESTLNDYQSLSDNTQSLIAERSAKQRHEDLGTKSLLTLVKTEAIWEYQIRTLEQIAPKEQLAVKKEKTTNSAERRLRWIVESQTPYDMTATPMEQVLSKTGKWSSGRRVSLKRLKEEANSLPHLTEQDKKAASTINKLRYGWDNTVTYETHNRTLYYLIGHPHVYDEGGQRVSVQEKPPQLTLQKYDNDLLLSMEPSGYHHQYVCQYDSPQKLVWVTFFNALQRRLGETLPTEGIRFPPEAESRLQELLKTLSSVVGVQGNTSSAASETLTGNAEPLLELDLQGDELWVRVRVEPLSHSNTFFDAGLGGSLVYIQSDKGSLAVERDLQKELDAMHTMINQLPTLSTFYDGRNTLTIQGIDNALELISELKDTNIRCLWPKNVSLRVESNVSTSQLQINVKSAKEWFTANGDLQYSGTDSLSLMEVLSQLSQPDASRFIELDNGKYLALSRSLQKQLSAMQAFNQSKDDDKATNIKLHSAALLALDPFFNEAATKTDKKTGSVRSAIASVLKQPVKVPPTLQAELRSYQQEGYEWLSRLGSVGAGACLADDMGLGKTLQALALLLSRAEGGPALVVAPTSVLGNWASEAQRFAPTLNLSDYGAQSGARHELLDTVSAFDVVVVSYGLMTIDNEHLQKVHWHTVVLDEAQAIKNAKSLRARAAKQLVADFRVITTGTPVQNNLMDLHSLFSFTNPQLLGSETAFRKKFAIPIERDNNAVTRTQLQQIVSPFMLRRHKRDVLQELPARTEINLEVNLSEQEATLYESLREEALTLLTNSNENNDSGNLKFKVLAHLTKLRRLCCNPKLVAPNWTGNQSKLTLCIEVLQELIENGHKALVFSQFVDHLKIVEQRLKDTGIKYQYLDGSTPAKSRTDRVNAFQRGEGSVFLISLTAGGTGLNLTAADYVVHLDPWWNPAVEDQASDRAHRLGQQRPVTIYRMVTKGTIEEKIQTLHSTKRDLAESVLAGSENTTIQADELIALLQHG